MSDAEADIEDALEDAQPVSMVGSIKVPIKIKEHEVTFQVHVTAPGPREPLPVLEEALQQNRELLEECAQDFINVLKEDYYERKHPFQLNYEGVVQTALMARLNINVLIPLINVRGGYAKYSKFEAMPVDQHIEWMLKRAERSMFVSRSEDVSTPWPYVFSIAAVTIITVLALIAAVS